VIKLADFGLARAFNYPMRAYTHEVVTMWYRSPEILLGKQRYACPTDMWSLGCIFYEMLTNNALFCGDSEIDQIFKVFHILGTPQVEDWPELPDLPDWKPNFPQFAGSGIGEQSKFPFPKSSISLIMEMLKYDPNKRVVAHDAMNSQYFESADKSIFPGSKVPLVPYYDKQKHREMALKGLVHLSEKNNL
jgi:serine/threonine protein kinase